MEEYNVTGVIILIYARQAAVLLHYQCQFHQCKRQFVSWYVLRGFPRGSDGKESACSVGYLGSIPGLEKIPWKTIWQTAPLFLPRKFRGQRSMAGYRPWGHRVRDNWAHTLCSDFTDSLKGSWDSQNTPCNCCCIQAIFSPKVIFNDFYFSNLIYVLSFIKLTENIYRVK